MKELAGRLDGIVRFETTDGGRTWQDLSFFQYRDFYAVKFMDELTGYASGYPGIVYKTTDGGVSWQQLSTGSRGYLRSMHFVSQDTILAVGGYVSSGIPKGEIIKSTYVDNLVLQRRRYSKFF